MHHAEPPAEDDLSKTVHIILPPTDGSATGLSLDALPPVTHPATLPKHDPTLDALYDAVFLTDPNAVILDCNQRAAEHFHLGDRTLLLGVPLYLLFAGHYQRFLDELHKHLSDHPFLLLECRALRFDKTSFIAEIAVSRAALSQGFYLFSVRDITIRAQEKLRLQAAVERLEAGNRDRMDFVSNVSHELRTPLTSMIYAVNNMLRGLCGVLPDKAIEYLKRLQGDERRLMTTINDILDMRQIENNTLTLHRTPTPITRLLTSVIEALRIQADLKKIVISLHAPDHELFLSADSQKLERVFFNVIANAVKFTPEGGHIDIHLAQDPVRPTLCRILINDDGIGIPPEAIPYIARRYFRVGEHVAGTGLGLAIVREIVELHGGTFAAHSPVPGTERGTQIELQFETIPGPEVVIVSGSEETLYALKQHIAGAGYTVTTDNDGRQIIEHCHDTTPALFLIDATFAESFARETIVRLRETPITSKVPIIVLSDITQPDRIQGYARMHVEILSPDYRPKDLQTLLQRLLFGNL